MMLSSCAKESIQVFFPLDYCEFGEYGMRIFGTVFSFLVRPDVGRTLPNNKNMPETWDMIIQRTMRGGNIRSEFGACLQAKGPIWPGFY
jgi:hypothetical protein